MVLNSGQIVVSHLRQVRSNGPSGHGRDPIWGSSPKVAEEVGPNRLTQPAKAPRSSCMFPNPTCKISCMLDTIYI